MASDQSLPQTSLHGTSSTPIYHIERLPETDNAEILAYQSRRLRELRLKSLLTDQESFYSQYRDEVHQPQEFWLNRLRDKYSHHWVAIDRSLVSHKNSSDTSMAWVGVLVVIEARGPTPESAEQDNTKYTADYSVGAVWVNPDQRGRGLCTAMINAALDWTRDQTLMAGKAVARVDLGVRIGNEKAKRLYTNLGFSVIGQEFLQASNGEDYIMDKMEMRLIVKDAARQHQGMLGQ